MYGVTQDVSWKGKVQSMYEVNLSSRVRLSGGFVAVRTACWENCNMMLWIELRVCHVCATAQRLNKSIITIINGQLMKQVCCSGIIKTDNRGTFGGWRVSGVRVKTDISVVLRVIRGWAVTAVDCTGRPLPYISSHITSWGVLIPVIAIWGCAVCNEHKSEGMK
jgi:hypothetical protein